MNQFQIFLKNCSHTIGLHYFRKKYLPQKIQVSNPLMEKNDTTSKRKRKFYY